MIRNKSSKFALATDILPRYLHGADYPSKEGKKSRGEKRKRGKSKLRFPPIGGWRGGSPDSNGLKMTETYGGGGTMRKSQCFKKGKAKRA